MEKRQFHKEEEEAKTRVCSASSRAIETKSSSFGRQEFQTSICAPRLCRHSDGGNLLTRTWVSERDREREEESKREKTNKQQFGLTGNTVSKTMLLWLNADRSITPRAAAYFTSPPSKNDKCHPANLCSSLSAIGRSAPTLSPRRVEWGVGTWHGRR